jgi:hypothetical protein
MEQLMKFDILTGQPVVTATLDARTAVDHRMKRLDLEDTLRKVLADNGLPIERHTDGRRYVRGLSCGHEACGETWNTLENHPAVAYVTPSSEVTYPRNPRYLRCGVCGGPSELSSGVFPRLVTKNRKQALDRYSITKLLNQDHTAVRSRGKTVVSGESFQRIARAVAPSQPDLDLDFEAALVQACSIDVATEAVRSDSFPNEAFVVVPVAHTLWPKAAWHSQRMTATDSEPIRLYAREQRREADKAIENEVAQFRAELSARQRA